MLKNDVICSMPFNNTLAEEYFYVYMATIFFKICLIFDERLEFVESYFPVLNKNSFVKLLHREVLVLMDRISC